MKHLVSSEVLRGIEENAKSARALIKRLPKSVQNHINECSGISVATIAEIYTAYTTNSVVVGGEGKDCANGIDTKFATLKRNPANGGYCAKVSHLKNKTGPIMVIVADHEFPENHSLFLRAFRIPYKVWSEKMATKKKKEFDVSIRQDKTTTGWYAKYEVAI